jgi:hypothetical protein
MTRAEAEVAITNIQRTLNLITMAIDSDDTARADFTATMNTPAIEIDEVPLLQLRRRGRRRLRELKEIVYDDAKTNGEI